MEAALADLRAAARPFTYAYMIWRAPWMSVTNDTFIHSMLACVGGRNVFGDASKRFPEVTPADLAGADPDWLLLSSEPFPFRPAHRDELARETGIAPERIRFVDGEYCSWHGTRMLPAFAYLAACMADGFPSEPAPA
jgi:hypothetical protein